MDTLLKIINENNYILIAKHKNPDWDAHGSAHGLKHIIQDNFKNKKVLVVGWDIEKNQIEIDSNLLNEEIISKALLITVDVANYDRIDFDSINLINNIYKIDHHLEVDNYTSNKLVDTTAISCTQVITLWADENELIISKKAAYYLFYGLITDSSRFLYKNTNHKSFQAAMILTQKGIDITEIYTNLYQRSYEQAKWNSKCFNKIKFSKNKKIAFLILKRKHFKNKKLNEHEIKSSLFIFTNIKEIDIWYIAYKAKDSKKIKVSIRSKKYNINKVAQEFQGGGHILASGFVLDSKKYIKVLNKKLEKLILEGV
ncbi:DHH family protein [Spiroplasma corruscae]|uniref:DHH family protein n=1 Tax=Spiroplasma corruscae TaxID=216934 RepID=A0A222EQP2_9MOLU|nr:DHHA1 domain-containing protein [Spiroplasma corruscae]ASP28736.1 DHH family protein [Spiroplasma corruscae]